MTLDIHEALRYLGVKGISPDGLYREAEDVAAMLTDTLRPRWTYRVFPLEQTEDGFVLTGSGVTLSGRSASLLLEGCTHAALMACTLGARFDELLRREQARDMGRAAILDACGSAWVEAGCDEAERELAGRLPGKFLTDRFSPGYGDMPLSLQSAVCAALDTEARLGLHVTKSFLMLPMKSVTAVIGAADTPRPARVRGCAYCARRESCTLHKEGKRCEL